MAISVHTNYANLVTQNTLQSTNNALTKSMERLSTGFRINSAADDAAGLQIANRLNLQSRGLNVAMRNSQDAISMMQTAEGAMDEMTNIAYRMSDLATQAANGTYTVNDRAAMDAEFQELTSELNNIFSTTNFGGNKLLDTVSGSFGQGAVAFQIGSTATDILSVDVSSELTSVFASISGSGATADDRAAIAQSKVDFEAEANRWAESGGAAGNSALTDGDTSGWTAAVGGPYTDYADLTAQASAGNANAITDLAQLMSDVTGSLDTHITAIAGTAGNAYNTAGTANLAAVEALNPSGGMDITTDLTASAAITQVSQLVDELGAARSKFGANINRLDHTITNLGNITENIDTSRGRIMDTDFASESGMMSKSQMLMQSGASMLSASKMVPQLAMSLLG